MQYISGYYRNKETKTNQTDAVPAVLLLGAAALAIVIAYWQIFLILSVAAGLAWAIKRYFDTRIVVNAYWRKRPILM